MDEAEKTEQLHGTVEEIVYRNEDNGYTVMEIACDEELVTVVGEVPGIAVGEEVTVTGQYTVHPNYGMQFKAQLVERTLPSTANAILKFLSSGAIKGVGPAFAKRIVSMFGDDTLAIIENQPGALARVYGISPKKAMQIENEFKRLFGVRRVMLFLSQHQIEASAAIRVWKRWGDAAVELIQDNPYALCCEEVGIPFEQVDEMAEGFGVGADSLCRIRAGILHILRHNSQCGHTCLPEDKLRLMTSEYLQVPAEKVDDLLLEMEEDYTLRSYRAGERTYYYLSNLYLAENYIAARISTLLQLQSPQRRELNPVIDLLEQELGISYDAGQRRAICEAVESPILILTGGPGTGKTTTLNGMLALFEQQGLKVALAAPTGRAAKRMSEVTGREAKTIHRLLEVDPFKQGLAFKRNEKNPLPADVVIVDEMSMVDTLLLDSLLRAMRLSAKLVMVGDSNQLPSVAAGNILKDLVDSELVPTVHLEKIFRQAAESLIVTNAHALIQGELPDLSRRDRDFFFLKSPTQRAAQDLTVDLCVRRLPKSYGFSPLWDIQVIVPGKKGPIGTQELNRRLQQELNPADRQKADLTVFGRTLREGDKVMQIRNNYEILWKDDQGDEGQGIFNGDIGVIDMIDPPSKTILVRFDDRVAQYSFENADQLEHAYAITVHKSQGSEFEAVVMPLMQHHSKLHYRNLLYTAITRAKKLLVMVGDRDTVYEMASNNRRTLRYTNLKEMLWGYRDGNAG